MTNMTRKTALSRVSTAIAAISATCAVALAPSAMASDSEVIAQVASTYQSQIRQEPVAGQYDKRWFNYQTDIKEAEKELQSDLKRATDREDSEDAWEEYHHELVDADLDYVKAMRKRGFRVGRVTLAQAW